MNEQSYDPNEVGFCDHCDLPYVLGSDDHNPETGNHYECEDVVEAERKADRLLYGGDRAPW